MASSLLAAAAEACAQEPSIKVSAERLAQHLAERPGAAHVRDLLIALGCAERDRAAIALLEAECIRHAQGALAKRAIAPEIIEEANQNVRERLLVGEVAPKILDYDGKGELRSWVRVVIVREAIHLAKRGKKEVSLSYDLLEVPASQDDPEVAYFKAHYRAEYKDAFQHAVKELTSRERALLRQQVVLGMSVDEIGAVYQVHRATAARWVQSAREELLAKARLQLAIRLELPRAELETIVHMIESQLVMSMGRLLKATQ